MKNIVKVICLYFSCFVFIGCNTHIMHKWQMEGNDRYVCLNTDDWAIVSQSLYVAVPEDQIVYAGSLLQEEDYIELSGMQEKTFIGDFVRPSDWSFRDKPARRADANK